jgi:hypothetical protein
MISVYVRELEELQGHYLGDFMPNDIASLVQVFQQHLIYTTSSDNASFVGTQFVAADDLYDGATVFEIMIQGIADFENDEAWTVDTGTTGADTTQYVEGSQGRWFSRLVRNVIIIITGALGVAAILALYHALSGRWWPWH